MRGKVVTSVGAVGMSVLAIVSAVPASGASTTTAGKRTVTVTPTTGLDPLGQRLLVTGKGFDPRVGIYVALCVVPPAGQAPSPCGGGVNMSAVSPSSVWISSNPPPYGAGLAKPYGKGGTFKVTLQVTSKIGDVDCHVTQCGVVTRADHLRAGDRRFDVIVPVSFQ